MSFSVSLFASSTLSRPEKQNEPVGKSIRNGSPASNRPLPRMQLGDAPIVLRDGGGMLVLEIVKYRSSTALVLVL
jgi:hypothetical protein